MQALVIDDNPSIRHMINDLLTIENIKVDLADSGLAGVMKVKEKSYDVILLDIKMPSLNGEQFLGILKKLNKPIPVLVISGYLTKELIIKLSQSGVKGFLTKPFDPKSFYEAFNQVCGTNLPAG